MKIIDGYCLGFLAKVQGDYHIYQQIIFTLSFNFPFFFFLAFTFDGLTDGTIIARGEDRLHDRKNQHIFYRIFFNKKKGVYYLYNLILWKNKLRFIQFLF